MVFIIFALLAANRPEFVGRKRPQGPQGIDRYMSLEYWGLHLYVPCVPSRLNQIHLARLFRGFGQVLHFATLAFEMPSNILGALPLKGLDAFLSGQLVLPRQGGGGGAAGFFDLPIHVLDFPLQREFERLFLGHRKGLMTRTPP